jgi:hypothetical protein
MLTRTFTGSSAIDFAIACREVVAAAVGGRSPARLLDSAGEVVFEVDDRGLAAAELIEIFCQGGH